jgi:hypothetical protein
VQRGAWSDVADAKRGVGRIGGVAQEHGRWASSEIRKIDMAHCGIENWQTLGVGTHAYIGGQEDGTPGGRKLESGDPLRGAL